MIITIDGPSGTGKSTIAKILAKTLGFYYCNTGVMYRTLAFVRLQNPWKDLTIEQLLSAPFSFSFDHQGLKAFWKDRPLRKELFTQETTDAVRDLANRAVVREFVQSLQRQYAKLGNCIFDGRDMGSKVFPEAELKNFLNGLPRNTSCSAFSRVFLSRSYARRSDAYADSKRRRGSATFPRPACYS